MVKVAGFDCWYPCAPGIGENFGPIWNRVSTVCPHHPAYLFDGTQREWKREIDGNSLRCFYLVPLFVNK